MNTRNLTADKLMAIAQQGLMQCLGSGVFAVVYREDSIRLQLRWAGMRITFWSINLDP